MTDTSTIDEATARLTSTISRLADADWSGDTTLPGWTRAHLVAHLVLNAEGLAAALVGVNGGQRVPMYASAERRDSDIDQLAAEHPTSITPRLERGCASFHDALAALSSDRTGVPIERTTGGPAFEARETASMRRREVEIHHADLVAGYSAQDWPTDFVTELLDKVTGDRESDGPFRVSATDLGRGWTVGSGEGPEVSGPGGALGWWLTGRGTGEDLICPGGVLPRLGPWAPTRSR